MANVADSKRRPDWMKYPRRKCFSLYSCEVCKESILLGQFYYDGGFGRRAHETCVVDKCPECGAPIHRDSVEEAGVEIAWCSENCGWEVVV